MKNIIYLFLVVSHLGFSQNAFNLNIVPGNSNYNISLIGANNMFIATGDNAELGVDLIIQRLELGDVTILTTSGGSQDGDITVLGDINFDGLGIRTLSLNSFNDIFINGTISDLTEDEDIMNLELNANPDGGEFGNVYINNTVNLFNGNFSAAGDTFTLNGSIGANNLDISPFLNGSEINLENLLYINNIYGCDKDTLIGTNESNVNWSETTYNDGNLSFNFIGIETIIGASLNDNLNGDEYVDIFTFIGYGQGNLDGLLFNGIESFNGHADSDIFKILNGGDFEVINGGYCGDGDILDYSLHTGPIEIITDTSKYNNIHFIVGTNNIDTIIGTDNSENFHLTMDGIQYTQEFCSPILQNFETIMGMSGDDIFSFSDGAIESFFVDGGQGYDRIDFISSGGPINYSINDFPNIEIVIGSGNAGDTVIGTEFSDSFNIYALNRFNCADIEFEDFENIMGMGGDDIFYMNSIVTNINGGSNGLNGDVIIGGSFENIFSINSLEGGIINGTTFSSIENLVGGQHNDSFFLETNGSLSGEVNGLEGNNQLYGSNVSGQVFYQTESYVLVNGIIFTEINNINAGNSYGDSLIIEPSSASSNLINGNNYSNFTSIYLLPGFSHLNGIVSDIEEVYILDGSTLGGIGTINANSINVGFGAITSGSSPGILELNSDVIANSNSKFIFEINGLSPGTEYDQLLFTGSNNNIVLNNAELELILNTSFNIGDSFTILDGFESITGQFTQEEVIIVDNVEFSILYNSNNVTLTVSNLLNSIELNSNKKISIFPNPTKNIINIISDEVHLNIEIFNSFNQNILSSKSTHQIDVSSLANGLYFIKISDKEKSIIKKFIKY